MSDPQVGADPSDEGHPSALEDPREAAAEAGLSYVSPDRLTIERLGNGEAGFTYRDRAGAVIDDLQTLERIHKLAIPPAWRDVRISDDPNGHLQATGLDQRGRKQYRYHPQFRAVRDRAKYEHLVAFAEALPALREHVRRDMARHGLSRERVLATVVRLLETTMIRVGGEAYAEANQSYGLATLRSRHVEVLNGVDLKFHFKGKSGKEWRVGLHDRRVAAVVRACQELPGQALFQYVDEHGERQAISSTDVNAYLKAASGADISAKDFRTWWGTVLAAMALEGQPSAASEKAAHRTMRAAIKQVASLLGNTPAICLKCYVHPEIVAAHLAGGLTLEAPDDCEPPLEGLSPEERKVLAFLRRRTLDLRSGETTSASRT